jgi:hypothetical protein
MRLSVDVGRMTLPSPEECFMASETETTPTVAPGPTIPAELLPETIRRMAAEINAYLRELPRLLAEGEEGRHALIKDDTILSIWDTYGDALQAGYERFGIDGRFVAHRIQGRDLERFLTLLPGQPGPS